MTKRVYMVLAAIALASLVGCAPQANPSQAPTIPVPSPLQKPGPGLSADEAAWEQIVQTARKEGQVTGYDYFLVGEAGIAVKAAFEKRYGIKLNIITGRGAEFLERVKTERRMGQMTADYVGSSPANIMNFKQEGLTEATFDRLPELKDRSKFIVDIRELDPAGHLLAYDTNYYTTYINTKLVKPEEAPKSLQDYLDPKWKGKIVARDPVVSSGEYILWTPLLSRGIIDRTYLRALGDQKLMFHVSSRGSAEMVARGEAALHTPNADISFAPLALAGAPVKAVPLEHGASVFMNSLAAIKNNPHPNAALVYLNWALSQEGQTVYMKAVGQASIRKDVQDFRHPNIVSGNKIALVVTEKDALDSAQAFTEKTLVPLLKR